MVFEYFVYYLHFASVCVLAVICPLSSSTFWNNRKTALTVIVCLLAWASQFFVVLTSTGAWTSCIQVPPCETGLPPHVHNVRYCTFTCSSGGHNVGLFMCFEVGMLGKKTLMLFINYGFWRFKDRDMSFQYLHEMRREEKLSGGTGSNLK